MAGICNSVGDSIFFDMPPRCRWKISVGVTSRAVNRKQVDVAASRSSHSCTGMHAMTTVGVALSETAFGGRNNTKLDLQFSNVYG